MKRYVFISKVDLSIFIPASGTTKEDFTAELHREVGEVLDLVMPYRPPAPASPVARIEEEPLVCGDVYRDCPEPWSRDQRATYKCTLTKGHDGPHNDQRKNFFWLPGER